MRIRLIPATIVAGLFVALLSASPAAASEETVGSCALEVLEHHGFEHVEDIVTEGHADGASDSAQKALEDVEEELEDCLEAPSPIIPELNEIIWGGGAFLVLLGLMLWKGFPAVKNIMDERTDRIANDLDEAERAKTDAQGVKAQYDAELADAKAEAARIIEEARQQAGEVRASLEARAEADIAEMRVSAQAEADGARSRAMAELQSEVSDIVVGAAERVVQANLDRDAQAQLIEDYINSVGSR